MNVTVRGRTQHFRTVTFDRAGNAVLLIEQRLLPHEFKIVATKNFRETAARHPRHGCARRAEPSARRRLTGWRKARGHFAEAI